MCLQWRNSHIRSGHFYTRDREIDTDFTPATVRLTRFHPRHGRGSPILHPRHGRGSPFYTRGHAGDGANSHPRACRKWSKSGSFDTGARVGGKRVYRSAGRRGSGCTRLYCTRVYTTLYTSLYYTSLVHSLRTPLYSSDQRVCCTSSVREIQALGSRKVTHFG